MNKNKNRKMYEKTSKVLLDFTFCLFPESGRTVMVNEAVKSYILGKNSFEMTSSFCEAATGTSEPIKRLKKIVDACTRSASSTPRNPLPGKKTRPWTQTEDNRLLAGILKFGIDNWAQISKFVGNGRTRPQCSQRYFRALDPKISKETWTGDEDQKLLNLIREYGTKKWTQIGEILGNRTDVQCRYRYKQLQRKMVGSTISDHQSGKAFAPMSAMNAFFEQSSPEAQPSVVESQPLACIESNVSSAEATCFDEALNHLHQNIEKKNEQETIFDRQVESFFAFDENEYANFAMF